MHIWVIEMLSTASGKWVTCAEAKLTKPAATKAAKEWNERNPFEQFRVRKYTPALK